MSDQLRTLNFAMDYADAALDALVKVPKPSHHVNDAIESLNSLILIMSELRDEEKENAYRYKFEGDEDE